MPTPHRQPLRRTWQLAPAPVASVCLVTSMIWQNQLSPLSYTSEWIGKVVVVVALASAVLAIGGLGYRWYANRKAKRLAAALGTAPA